MTRLVRPSETHPASAQAVRAGVWGVFVPCIEPVNNQAPAAVRWIVAGAHKAKSQADDKARAVALT